MGQKWELIWHERRWLFLPSLVEMAELNAFLRWTKMKRGRGPVILKNSSKLQPSFSEKPRWASFWASLAEAVREIRELLCHGHHVTDLYHLSQWTTYELETHRMAWQGDKKKTVEKQTEQKAFKDHKQNVCKSVMRSFMDAIHDVQQSELGWNWPNNYGSETIPVQVLCLFCVDFVLLNWKINLKVMPEPP